MPQVLPTDVDYRVMLTFLEFYSTMLRFVHFRLYHSAPLVLLCCQGFSISTELPICRHCRLCCAVLPSKVSTQVWGLMPGCS